MLVRRIELAGFTRYDTAVVELPATGITLVTGGNGEGKSSLLNAVSWATWGRTLRGNDPWRPDATCAVQVDGPAVTVRREHTGKRTGLTWHRPGEGAATYETTTKAQAALDAVVGSFDLWRRTRVFTSADAWAFAAATDAQRKGLLETLLGLDMFDTALTACRDDLRRELTAQQRAEQRRAELRGKLNAAREHAAALERSQPVDADDDGDTYTRLQRVDAALEGLVEDIAELAGAVAAATNAVTRARTLKAHAQHVVAGVADPVCRTCGQPVSDEHAARARADAAAEGAAAEADEARALTDLSRLKAEGAAAEADQRKLRAERDTLMKRQAARAQREQNRAAFASLLTNARAAVTDLEGLTDAAERAAAVVTERVDDLRAVEQVLGLRGVRAQVLEGALHAVQTAANVWMARFAGEGVELRLHSSKALKGGGVSDTIDIELLGYGGHEGFAGASEGERRRVNVALMLALAEVLRARAGDDAGTLWFDEVFDVLDPAGVEAVCAALREVAADRPVVVITFNDDMIARLAADVRLHVHGGRITRT